MTDQFFERPILNSPYEIPAQHWELDASGQPTQRILPSRRRAEFITPIPKPRKQKDTRQDILTRTVVPKRAAQVTARFGFTRAKVLP